jgi:HNH endonuclease
LPATVLRELDHLFGYRCACCLSDSAQREHHHLQLRSEGGPDDADNLLPLCRNCHGWAHRVLGPAASLDLLSALRGRAARLRQLEHLALMGCSDQRAVLAALSPWIQQADLLASGGYDRTASLLARLIVGLRRRSPQQVVEVALANCVLADALIYSPRQGDLDRGRAILSRHLSALQAIGASRAVRARLMLSLSRAHQLSGKVDRERRILLDIGELGPDDPRVERAWHARMMSSEWSRLDAHAVASHAAYVLGTPSSDPHDLSLVEASLSIIAHVDFENGRHAAAVEKQQAGLRVALLLGHLRGLYFRANNLAAYFEESNPSQSYVFNELAKSTVDVAGLLRPDWRGDDREHRLARRVGGHDAHSKERAKARRALPKLMASMIGSARQGRGSSRP